MKILLVAGVSHLLGFVLRIFVRRNPNYWTIIGREHGKFLDNAKHFTCLIAKDKCPNREICFLTEHSAVIEDLRGTGVKCLLYPGIPAIWRLLRTGVFIVDSMDYMENGRIGLIANCRVIQLWHGVPLKQIELSLHQRRLNRLRGWKKMALTIYMGIIGRYRKVDVLLSTSPFVTLHCFSKCFQYRKIIHAGYPRNEILLNTTSLESKLSMLNVDLGVREIVRDHKAKGGRVVIYTPTFRKDRHSPFGEDKFDLSMISQFCISNEIILLLKLHPLMSDKEKKNSFGHVITIDSDSDIYPILKNADLLITDYSSIYFDFLLLDRPIIFFPYDFSAYIDGDRPLFFDYEKITPGEKVFNSRDLVEAMGKWLKGDDDWKTLRDQIRNDIFTQGDEVVFKNMLKQIEFESI